MEGDIRALKKLCIRVDYQLFQTILGAKFDENNMSAFVDR